MDRLRLAGALLVALLAFSCATRSTLGPSRIVVSGSDTMLILTQRWAEAFMLSHDGLSVQVEGGGTETGVRALVSGSADVCAASRPLRPEETQQLADHFRRLGVSTMVARDALSVYLHPDNPVDDLSLDQLRGIFTGRLRNWADVGGPDRPIIVLVRSPNSGTRGFFQQHVLQGSDYDSLATILPTTAAIVASVASTPAAIGYGGLAHGDGVKRSRIDGVAPTAASIRNDRYPISRYLYLVTVDKPRGSIRQLLDWVLSPAGQAIARDVGFVPLLPLQQGR